MTEQNDSITGDAAMLLLNCNGATLDVFARNNLVRRYLGLYNRADVDKLARNMRKNLPLHDAHSHRFERG